MTTRVCHTDDQIPGAEYIGRAVPRRGLKASKWANPYKIGDRKMIGDGVLTRDEVIYRYEQDLLGGPKRHLLADLPELRTVDIACWCRHDGEDRDTGNACHADVLIELLEKYSDEELRAMGGDTA
jgi:hypothetical protein